MLIGHPGLVILVALAASPVPPTDNQPVLEVVFQGGMRFSPDSHYFVASRQGEFFVWDMRESVPVERRQTHGGRSPDFFSNRWLWTRSRGFGAGVVYEFWDLASADPFATSCRITHGGKGHQLDPSGRWLALFDRDEVVGRYGTAVTVWDLEAKDAFERPRLDLSANEMPQIGSFSTRVNRTPRCCLGPGWLAATGTEGTVKLWHLDAEDTTENPMILEGKDANLDSLAVSADGRYLALSGNQATSQLWDLDPHRQCPSPLSLPNVRSVIQSIVVTADGRWLVTTTGSSRGRNEGVAITDLRSNPPTTRHLLGSKYGFYTTYLSSNSRWLLTMMINGLGVYVPVRYEAKLWNLTSIESLQPKVLVCFGDVLRGVDGSSLAEEDVNGRNSNCTMSEDDRWIIETGSERRQKKWTPTNPRLWSLEQGDPVQTIIEHPAEVSTIRLDPTLRWLLTGDVRSDVRLWDLTSSNPAESPIYTVNCGAPLRAVKVSSNGRWIAVQTADVTDNPGRIQLYCRHE